MTPAQLEVALARLRTSAAAMREELHALREETLECSAALSGPIITADKRALFEAVMSPGAIVAVLDTVPAITVERARELLAMQVLRCVSRLSAHIQAGGKEACATVAETPLVEVAP